MKRRTVNLKEPRDARVRAGRTTYTVTEKRLAVMLDNIVRDTAIDHLETMVVEEAMELDVPRTLKPEEILDVACTVFDEGAERFWQEAIEAGFPVHEEAIHVLVDGCYWNWKEAFDCWDLLDKD